MELCGKYLNRGRFILCCMFVPIAMLLGFTENILLAAGQDERVSYFAGLYVKCYLPGLFLQVMNDTQRRFLNALGKTVIPLCTQVIGVSLHFLWSWLFVFHFELGVMGTAYAGIITNGTVLTLNIICAYSMDSVKPAIVAPGAYMWQGIGDYLEIGLPCMLMVLLDGGAWHLMTFTCGFLGVDA